MAGTKKPLSNATFWWRGLLVATPLVTLTASIVVALTADVDRSSVVAVSASLIAAELVAVLLNEVLGLGEGVRALEAQHTRLARVIDDMAGHYILLDDVRTALGDPLLRNEYGREVESHVRRVSALGDGHFEVEMRDIIPLSLDVIHGLSEEGFATVLVSETSWIFDSPLGQRYLRECYDAASRIPTFVRLFIIRNPNDITPRMYELMEEHAEHGVDVRVIYEQRMKDNDLPVVDFGLWDKRYLMVIHPIPGQVSAANLEVYVGGHQVEFYQRTIEDLMAIATPWTDFRDELCQPLNASWNSMLPSRDGHPIPIGPSDTDVEVIWKLTSERLQGNPGKILVLGYTAKLVDFLVSNGCQVTVLDIGYYSPPYGEEPVTFIQGNWLKWRDTTGGFDAIVGDDVLNNLSRWQYYLFFRNVASLLRPHGVLVMRAHCRYEPTNGLPNFEEVYQELRRADGQNEISVEMVYVKTWPMFLSEEFYDHENQTFDMGQWDRRIAEIDPLHSKLKLGYQLKQSCLAYEELVGYARRWFTVSAAVPVDEAYSCLDPRFSSLYRILAFVEARADSASDAHSLTTSSSGAK